MKVRTIAVIGSGGPLADDLYRLCHELGDRIMQAGYNLVTGGLGGVMEAASRGARESSAHGPGRILGILPGEDASQANPYLDWAIPTGMGAMRNHLVVRAADLVILVNGCSGSLSEVALAWQWNKPVIALKDSGGWAQRLAGEPIDQRRSDVIHAASSASEALQLAGKLLS